jgi:three-Cys-motif partner protein
MFDSARRKCNVVFFFIEEDQQRANALEEELSQLKSQTNLPAWVEYKVIHGQFAPEMTRLLDQLERERKMLAPTFAFIDPFGYSGVPLDVIARIARNPSCECLVTFVHQSIVRHGGKPAEWIPEHIDQLFGTNKWKAIVDNPNAEQRLTGLIDLYRGQLIAHARFKYVRTFSMYDRTNQSEYVLFFGTNSPKGLSEMKQAMWKADPLSGQTFSDRTDSGQMVLLDPNNDLQLQYLLQKVFRGRSFVRIEEISRFVLEETAYSEVSHLKMKTLAPMEKHSPPLIKVQRPLGKPNRAGSYPEGTKILFI